MYRHCAKQSSHMFFLVVIVICSQLLRESGIRAGFLQDRERREIESEKPEPTVGQPFHEVFESRMWIPLVHFSVVCVLLFKLNS